MMGSRGCPYKCGFCFKTPSDKKYRTRDVTQIVDEIEFVIDRYGVREVMFYDDIMPPKYAGALSREIIDRNVKIKWQTPQRVNLVDPELLELMAQAGCHILRYGVEQGDPEMMRYVEKKTHLPQVKSAFDWAKNAGIDTFAYFIIGYINETEKTMRATIDLAKELDPRYVMFTKAVPLPNTPLMFEAVKQGFVDSDYWTRFTLGEALPAIPPLVPNADKWVKKAYREFYLRPQKIVNQALSIRNVSDLRKNIDGFIGVMDFKMRDDDFTVVKSDVYSQQTH
jgi:DNA repair photolyase